MKTAEEWMTLDGFVQRMVLAARPDIEAIQRDAYKAGAIQMRSDLYEEVYAQYTESTGLNAGTPVIVRDFELPEFPTPEAPHD